MDIHLYTSPDNLEQLKQGIDTLVWTKEIRTDFDLHVSFSIDDYTITDRTAGFYLVSKKTSIRSIFENK